MSLIIYTFYCCSTCIRKKSTSRFWIWIFHLWSAKCPHDICTFRWKKLQKVNLIHSGLFGIEDGMGRRFAKNPITSRVTSGLFQLWNIFNIYRLKQDASRTKKNQKHANIEMLRFLSSLQMHLMIPHRLHRHPTE